MIHLGTFGLSKGVAPSTTTKKKTRINPLSSFQRILLLLYLVTLRATTISSHDKPILPHLHEFILVNGCSEASEGTSVFKRARASLRKCI